MKLFGFRINSGEIKDVREIEKTLESIEEKKNKIIKLTKFRLIFFNYMLYYIIFDLPL